MKPWVLGISGSHNGACCLLQGSDIQVAIQEERLTGVKRARIRGGASSLALRYCLRAAGIQASDLSMVVIATQGSADAPEHDAARNPDLKLSRGTPIRAVSHHLAHAASAYATSGFDRAAVLVIDGLGSPVDDLADSARAVVVEDFDGGWEHLSLFAAQGTTLTPLEVQTVAGGRWLERDPVGMARFFSLGGMFSAVAQQIFGDPMEAGKVMGLAPIGDPCIPVGEFVTIEDGRLSFPNLVQLRFRHHARWPHRGEEYANLAASVQRALEHALLAVVTRLRVKTGETNLAYAGGVALNSVANEVILRTAGFDRLHVVPAAEDSGVAIGAAYLGLWELGGSKPSARLSSDALGRSYSEQHVEDALGSVPGVVARRSEKLLDEVADRLCEGEVGGWFQGGAELGPRALGQRSILCSPCPPGQKDRLNAKVKFRESFRPFAPAVLAEHVEEWFDVGRWAPDSPFMLRVLPFRTDRTDLVPAVVHVDGTGRLQTLTREANQKFYELVRRFYERSGVPMLLNTSMNVRGEPLSETPEDALWALVGTGMDFCVVHDWLVTKAPEHPTFLDLVPRVIAEECSVTMRVSDGTIRFSLGPEDRVSMVTTTPWGQAEVLLQPRLFALLTWIDGRKTARDLCQAVGGEPHVSDVVSDLLVLRRMRVIELVEDDVAHDD